MEQLRPIRVSLRKRIVKSGISYFIDYRDPGTQKRIRRSVGRNKQKAELRRSEIEWKLFRGDKEDIPIAFKDASLNKFFDRFIDYCYKTRAHDSVKKDHSRFETLKRFFKDKNISKLSQISPGIVQELQAEYLQSHSKKSWNSLLGILKTMLNRAVEWDVINYNSIAKIKPLKLDKTFHYFMFEEINRIIESAKEPLKTAIMILVYTGLRRDELYNLRWRDVDLKNRIITVKPYGDFSTKSKKIRSIPMAAKLFEHLKSMKKVTEYVCRPYKSELRFWKQFKKLLRELKIKGTLHDLRHTFASHLAMAGVPVPVIKELLGHADITTTMIYAHLSPSLYKSEIEKLKF